MSVIEQALRRVQDPVLRAAQQVSVKTPPAAQPPAPVQPAEPAAHPWATAPTVPAPRAAPPTNVMVVAAAAVISLTVVLLAAGGFWLASRAPASGLSPARSEPPAAAAPRHQPSAIPATTPKSLTPPVLSASPAINEAARISRPAAPSAGEPSKRPLVLSGLVGGSGAPYAVINGEIIGVGETIEGYNVVAITDRSVTLRSANGREIVLSIPR